MTTTYQLHKCVKFSQIVFAYFKMNSVTQAKIFQALVVKTIFTEVAKLRYRQ